MTTSSAIRTAAVAVLLLGAGAGSGGVAGDVSRPGERPPPEPALRVLRQTDDGLSLLLETPVPTMAQVEQDGCLRQSLHVSGWALPAVPGVAAVPYRGLLVGAPPGARLELEVTGGLYSELEGVDIARMEAAAVAPQIEPRAGADPASGGSSAAVRPAVLGSPSASGATALLGATEYLGRLRGVETHAVRLFPLQYDADRQRLRVYHELHVRLRFIGAGSAAAAARAAARTVGADIARLWGSLINAEQAARWRCPVRVPKTVSDEWYDRSRPWLKLHVDADGIYRVDAAFLGQFTDPAAIDPRTLRLFYLGQEQPLVVAGEADGRLDSLDYVLFAAGYRRGSHDFDSLYGRRNTYWLTWGGAPGRRYVERSAAPPAGGAGPSDAWATVHIEVDEQYDPLPAARDLDRDHWFWRAVDGRSPTNPGSAIFAGEVPDPVLDAAYEPRVRVALHGGTAGGHHTVVRLNTSCVLADTIWGSREEGQSGLLVERAVPVSALRAGTNRVTVQVYADQERYDQVYFNWFEVDYRRQLVAHGGYLAFTADAGPLARVSVTCLRDRAVTLLAPAAGLRLTGLAADSTEAGIQVSFAHAGTEPVQYVLADSLGLRVPFGEPDTLSAWRRPDNAADYVVIAHPALMAPAMRLAAHRRGQGLRTAVVSTKDIYDEFGYGLVDADAVAAFIAHAYAAWDGPPAYVVLLGDDTYDYRNIQRLGVPLFVPSRYYQSAGRGRAPSDYLYSLVDGDDLLADVAIGRLPASSGQEAEAVVDKIIRYDTAPEPGDWRSRVLYLAGYHPTERFAAAADTLAARFTEPYGLESVKIYNASEAPVPNEQGRQFLDELARGALLFSFSGHGSSGSMWYFLSLQMPDYSYLSLVRNGGRLPLGLALSCLNGMFVDPLWESLAEAFTLHAGGGTIGYISATAQTMPVQNEVLSQSLYAQFFQEGATAFGPVLDAAKAQVLAAYGSWAEVALTMLLCGDPAQALAVPRLPDYAPAALELEPSVVRGEASVRLCLDVANAGRRTADSLAVRVRVYGVAGADAETLACLRVAGFGGSRRLELDWATGARRGAHWLEAVVDAGASIVEEDEGNNRLVVPVDILDPVLPVPVAPADGAVVPSAPHELVAAVPLAADPCGCDFRIAPAPDFPAPATVEVTGVPAVDGACAHLLSPAALAVPDSVPRFWQVRLRTGAAVSAWSSPRSFRLAAAAGAAWSQRGAQLRVGLSDSLAGTEAGVALNPVPAPFRPASGTREHGFTVRDMSGAGVVCTDGTYLYAKRWYNDNSTIYPGTDYFTRVGTGFQGTVAGANYGTLPDSTTGGISATCHGDGFIYCDSGRAYELERIWPATGQCDTVAVPDGLLEWRSGATVDGHSLITSDGRLIYNVAMSSPAGMRTEWRVRVFDPADGWRLVREFVSPPTQTGFTYLWTDGILADGHRLYFIEYGGGRRIRMVDARDGSFLAEWTGDQDTTRVVGGQYDWVNNKVWLGDLFGPAIFRYGGLSYVEQASVLSPAIGPAAAWREARIEASAAAPAGTIATEVLAEKSPDEWTPVAGLRLAGTGGVLDLRGVDARAHPRLRLRARLGGQAGAARLAGWDVDFVPLPSLAVCQARAIAASATGLRVAAAVRNLGAGTVSGAELTMEIEGRPQPVRRCDLPPLAPGRVVTTWVDSVPAPGPGERLYARVRTALGDAEPADDRLEVVLLFAGRDPIRVRTWPDGGMLRDGDLLAAGQGLAVSAPGVDAGSLRLLLDGAPATPDSLLDPHPDTGPAVLWRGSLAPGEHLLAAQLFLAGESVAAQQVRFRVCAALALANPLVFPAPVRGPAWLTYVVSAPAAVQAELFTLSGRLVRRLGPCAQEAGFGRLEWDGTDELGRPVANGTYLFRLMAAAGQERAAARGAFVVVR